MGLFVVGLDEVDFDVGLVVGSLIGFLVGATGLVVGARLVGFAVGKLIGFEVGNMLGLAIGVAVVVFVVSLVVGARLVGLFDVGFCVEGFVVGRNVGLADGLVVGRGLCGTRGLRGIVLVNVRLPSSINCTSPVKRRYQSEGRVYPSASKASQPFVG